MSRKLILRRSLVGVALLLGLALPGQASAQAPTSPRPALWAVRDADSTIYLFGTIHFMRPDADWRTDAVAAALAASQSLVLEVADPESQAAVLPLIQQYGTSPDRPLSTLLSDDDLRRLNTAAATIGSSAARMDPLRPWLAGVMLSGAVPARGGFDAALGVDVALRAEATAAGVPLNGLETPEEQIRMLSSFPEDGQIAFLRNTLDSVDQAPTELDRLAAAWRRGDVEGVATITLEPMKAGSAAVYEAVIVQRNSRWAHQIARMLDTPGTTFVAVGALHLAGEDSVLRRLSDDGLTVVRVQ